MPIDHWVERPGLRLHVLEWGDPDANPAVLVHGGCDHAAAWEAMALGLADRWRVLAPDLRGHGSSDWSPEGQYRKQDHVADVLAVTRSLGAHRVALIGHSLGANIALHYAAAFPERVSRLVAIEGMMQSPRDEAAHWGGTVPARLRAAIVSREKSAARTARVYPDLASAIAHLGQVTALDATMCRKLATTGMHQLDNGSCRWKYDPLIVPGPITDGEPAELDAILSAVACPTLLLYGADSPASRPSSDGRLAFFADAREVAIPNASHWVQHGALAATLDVVRQFLGSPNA